MPASYTELGDKIVRLEGKNEQQLYMIGALKRVNENLEADVERLVHRVDELTSEVLRLKAALAGDHVRTAGLRILQLLGQNVE